MWQEIKADFATHGRSLKDGGFWAMAVYRFGVWSFERKFGPWRWFTGKLYGVMKLISEQLTGVILDRQTKIGKQFHIVHAGGQAIHPNTVIGDRVGLMHNVTLGTNMGTDAPVLGNDVFVGCGASILGRVKIGDGARIAANSLVIANVPAGAIAMGVPAKIMPNLAALQFKKTAKPAEAPAAPPAAATPVSKS